MPRSRRKSNLTNVGTYATTPANVMSRAQRVVPLVLPAVSAPAVFLDTRARSAVRTIPRNRRAGPDTRIPIGRPSLTSAAAEDVIKAAAKALYRAKNGDRNP